MNPSEALHLASNLNASRMDAQSVLSALEELSQTMQPGDLLPTQLELIRRFNASDRAVRWALDELRRQGKVVSRRRVGTVVADKPPVRTSDRADSGVTNRTIIAIAAPGQKVFERALSFLFHRAESANLALVYRLFDPSVSSFPQDENPLGYVLFGRNLMPLGHKLQVAGHRVVLVATPYSMKPPGLPSVYGDQENGGYLVTKHLLDLGHQTIVVRGLDDWPLMRRWRGHKQALSEARLKKPIHEEEPIYEELYETWRSNPELAVEYFRRPEAPTGIIVWNDQMALSLLSLLSYVNIRVPHDVSLVGYDDLPEVQQVHPPLTTVGVGMDQQVRSALCFLMDPESPSPSQSAMVTSNLIIRESTAAPPR